MALKGEGERRGEYTFKGSNFYIPSTLLEDSLETSSLIFSEKL